MKLRHVILLLVAIVFIGCGGSGSQPAPQTARYNKDNNDKPNANDLNEILDYKKQLGILDENETDKIIYDVHWLQPVNKTEECKILMGGLHAKYLQKDLKKDYTLEWDGNCKNGKAQGIGKAIFHYGVVDKYEIGFLKDGKSLRPYCRGTMGLDNEECGKYLYNDKKQIFGTIYKIKTGDNEIYASQKNDTLSGYIVKKIKYDNGVTTISSGIAGLKTMKAFGSIRFKDMRGNEAPNIYYGYWNIKTNLFDGYGVLVNQYNGTIIKHGKFVGGKLVESIQIPHKFIEKAMKESAKAIENASDASIAYQEAMLMKQKYEHLHHVDVIAKNKPSQVHDEKESDTVSIGTGFFVSNNGYLLTNHHVVKGATKIYVIFNGKKIPAYVVEKDPANDIALLKANFKSKALPIDMKRQKVGEDIAVVGYPNITLQGNELKATFGNINARSGIQGDKRYYQIDAAMQPGNSGGPVLNMKGGVIGIATASLNQGAALKTTGALAQNVNYAIKISYAIPMLMNENVPYRTLQITKKLDKPTLIEKAKKSTVMVVAQ